MRLFARLFRLVWGDEVDRALRPVLAVSFVGSMCFSAGWSYVGIWAIQHLEASRRGIAPSLWGFIVVINPLLVTFFQLRITRATTWFPPGPKLVTAMLLMGGSFLLLLVSGSAAMFALVILIFVIGEMLWVPTSQAIVAGLAPEDVRGAYMAGWLFFAAISVAAAATGAIAVRSAESRHRGEPLPSVGV